jgi:hypothetical protein
MSLDIIDIRSPLAAADRAWSRNTYGATDGMVWGDELNDADIRADWLVKGLIERQSLFAIYGPPKSGKTFVATDLALHLATGRDWFSRKVKAPGLVVYVAGEGIGAVKRRVLAHRRDHGLTGRDLRNFAIVTSPLNLIDATSVDDLIEKVKDAERRCGQKAALVVIDTLARAIPGADEDRAADMGLAVSAADRIREETGAAVGVVHHSGKDTSRGMRGSNALLGAVDAAFAVERDKGGMSRLSLEAQRDGDGNFAVAFELRPVELGTDDDGDPVISCVVVPTDAAFVSSGRRKMTEAQKNVLDVLTDALARSGTNVPPDPHVPLGVVGVTEGAWRDHYYQRCADDLPDSRKRRFRRAVDELIACGTIAKWGEWVWLTKRTGHGT